MGDAPTGRPIFVSDAEVLSWVTGVVGRAVVVVCGEVVISLVVVCFRAVVAATAVVGSMVVGSVLVAVVVCWVVLGGLVGRWVGARLLDFHERSLWSGSVLTVGAGPGFWMGKVLAGGSWSEISTSHEVSTEPLKLSSSAL